MKKRMRVLTVLLLIVTLFGSTSVIFADEDLGTWTTESTARGGLDIAEVNGKIYAIGGFDLSEDSGRVLSTVEEYDPQTNTWTTKADMPTARMSLSVVEANGKIYAIGGKDYHEDSEIVLNTVEEYDPQTDSWTTKAHMPTARVFLSVAEANGKMYAIGGYAFSDDSVVVLNTVEAYDPQRDTWTTKATMSTARGGLGVAKVNGKIYAIGGSVGEANGKIHAIGEDDDDNDFVLNTVEEYTPPTP